MATSKAGPPPGAKCGTCPYFGERYEDGSPYGEDSTYACLSASSGRVLVTADTDACDDYWVPTRKASEPNGER